jgi:molybdopterin-binding protein
MMLELTNISKHYPAFSLEYVSLKVPDGSYFVLLGPSGAGKTQVLEIIAGLVKPDSGTIMADDMDITWLEARQRSVGIVFQDLAVFPHLNVEKNIAFALRNSRMTSSEIRESIENQAEALDIHHLLQRKPSSLSGGELQRVALARTLIRHPRYLLLDEPLSSLDVQIRQEMFGLLKKLHRNGQTVLHVTHDFEEALVLATHIGVIHKGKIIQAGPAKEVFHRPSSEFVARFSGVKNYFPARMKVLQGNRTAQLDNGMEIRLVTDEEEGKGFVMVPGEEIILSREKIESSAQNQYKGIVREIFNAPGGVEVMVDAGIPLFVKITADSRHSLGLEPGKEVWLSFKASGVRFISV